MAELFANLLVGLIKMEACSSTRYWTREQDAPGYTVKLMAPLFVKPYLKVNEHDPADAEFAVF